ncbi:MAG: hypothetical protein ACM3O3_13040 [Syntrophothermus sp.]
MLNSNITSDKLKQRNLKLNLCFLHYSKSRELKENNDNKYTDFYKQYLKLKNKVMKEFNMSEPEFIQEIKKIDKES